MKKLLIVIIMLPLITRGQLPVNETNREFPEKIQESVTGFSDRSLYLSGDVVWFSAFITVNGRTDEQAVSDLLYAELYDADTKVVARAKYLITGNLCNGNFKIPPEALSGAYFLRFYTKYQRNSGPQEFAVIPLTIINTGLTLPSSDKKAPAESSSLSGSQIEVKTDRTIYNTRQKVNLSVDPSAGFGGWLCVTVIRRGTGKNLQMGKSNLQGGENPGDTVFYLPDIRGVSLSGFVTDKNETSGLGNIPVYLSAFGTNQLLHITETKSNGGFVFPLNEMYGPSNVFVTIDPDASGQKEVFINTGFSNRFAPLPSHGFYVDSSYHNLLSAMQVDFETSRAFGKRSGEPEYPGLNNMPVTYDFSVRLDDYIELSSLEEVFYEIVPPVTVKHEKGTKYLSVANNQAHRMATAGMVLLDNVPVFNINELLKISPVNIERIDVFNRPYYLGDYLLSSVVSIKTKTGDFGGYKFPPQSIFLEYQTLEGKQQFHAPEYKTADSKSSRIPDFRTTLYWNPAMESDGEETSVSFYTSDARGNYEVVVRGIKRDGSVVGANTSFTVE